jgi:galactonate dehydratase
MKITKIETFRYWIDWCNWLFVKVSTDDGLYGWGEGTTPGAIEAIETAIHQLGRVLIGQDPAGVERHWQAMYRAWRWRNGHIFMTALGALDIALWDLEGKRLGVPVYRLLGGPFRERLRVYASHWLYHGVDTPQKAHDGAKEAVRRGFSGLKWIPFTAEALRENEGRALALATDKMAAIRDAVGSEVDIFVECAERLSPRTAPRAARAFEPYRPGWFEEPIPFENAKAMAQLQVEMPVPIALGERLLSRWQFREIFENQACKIAQPDLMHAGGITEVRKIAAAADTYFIPIAPHNPGGPICNAAALHLCASIPNFYILEQMEEERELRERISTNPIRCVDGHYQLPTEPGLGTDLRLDLLEEHKARPHPISGSSETIWF